MIDFYAMGSPNVVKVYIALEELGLPYAVHPVDVFGGQQFDAAFLRLNPSAKVPVIVDSEGPGGKPYTVFESGAILLYLAEKTGKLLPADAGARYETIAWLFWQVGGVGPMFGQVGFFYKFAGREYEDKRPLERYRDESKRLLAVLDRRLEGRDWVMGADYTIADISLLGWVRNLIGFYEARELVAFDQLAQVPGWLERGLARPAVQRGLRIPRVERK